MQNVPFLTSLVIVGCMMIDARAQQSQGITVVGRQSRPQPVVTINLALKDGKFYLGELPTQLQGETIQAIDRDIFLKLTSPVLKSELADTLRSLPSDGSFIKLGLLKDAGLAFEFDIEQLTLGFFPTVEQRPKGHVSLSQNKGRPPNENLSPAASVSGYINLNAGLQYTAAPPGGGHGATSPTLGTSSAIRVLNLVIENESTISSGSVAREGTRAIYDDPVNVLRYAAGDVTPVTVGLQGGSGLLGFAVQKSYGKLQPQKNIRPTGERSFRLDRPSQVDVIVNGQVVQRLQMPPGDHEISELPLKAGANILKLEITDDTGKHTTLEFTVFFDHTLLAPGVSEWAFAGGIKSTPGLSGLSYVWGSPAATGYYQLGLAEDLTGTLHAQADSNAAMTGVMAVTQSWFGSLSAETAGSVRWDGAAGIGVSAAYTPDTLFKKWNIPGSLQLAVNYRSPTFTPIFSQLKADEFSLNGSYSVPLPEDYTLAFSSSVSPGNSATTGHAGAAISLTRTVKPDMSWGLTASYDSSPVSISPAAASVWDIVARVNIKLGVASELSLTRDELNGRSVLGATSAGQTGDARYNLKANIERDPAAVTGDGSQKLTDFEASYSGPRFDLAASSSRRVYSANGNVIGDVSVVSGATAIAFADDHVAVGRPIADGFAIIAPHESLAGTTLRVAPGDTGTRGTSDWLGPALVSDLSAYSLTQLPIMAENAPEGYDLGSGVFDIEPSYKSGHVLHVGSDYHVSVVGSVVGADGKPFALLSGLAKEDAVPDPHKTTIFTNRAGRFSADGLKPGRWTIELIGNPPVCFRLDVPAGIKGVFDAGRLRTPCAS